MNQSIAEFYTSIFHNCEQEATQVRRHLHQHPELSFKEYQTKQYLIDKLSRLNNVKITEIDGCAGFYVDILTDLKQRHLVFRADMDALPTEERTGLNFASVNPGVMHACGHDIHCAVMYGTILFLSQLVDAGEGNFGNNLRFIFQHAEEQYPGGAQTMLERGVLSSVDVKYVAGLHVSPELPTGTFGMRKGAFMASSDELHYKIIGRGGHAALRRQYANPIIPAAELAMEIDKINNMDFAGRSHVAVIANFLATGSTNIIPDTAQLDGTMRTFDEDDRTSIKTTIEKAIDKLQNVYGCTIENHSVSSYPALINDEVVIDIIADTAKQLYGIDCVVAVPQRMTCDDFAYYAEKYPAAYIRLGCGGTELNDNNKLHSSCFTPDEKCIGYGMGLFSQLSVND